MKRRLLLILLLLVAGAIVNVAVAWGCAWWRIGSVAVFEIGFPSPEDSWLRSIDLDPAERDTYTVAEARARNERDEEIVEEAPAPAPFPIATTSPDEYGFEITLQTPNKKWSGPIEFNDTDLSHPDFRQVAAGTVGFEARSFIHGNPLGAFPGDLPIAQQFRCGWPCWTMYGDATLPTGTRMVMYEYSQRDHWFGYRFVWLPDGGVTAGTLPLSALMGQLPEWRVIPWLPIWPGFAINTVFYAFVLWLLLAAPFALRKRRRIKRGLCPKCAYDLRGAGSDSATCPECGATVNRIAR